MKINGHTLSDKALFYILVDDELPISVNNGNDLPFVAIWENGKPRKFDMSNEFCLPIDADRFEKMVKSQ